MHGSIFYVKDTPQATNLNMVQFHGPPRRVVVVVVVVAAVVVLVVVVVVVVVGLVILSL